MQPTPTIKNIAAYRFARIDAPEALAERLRAWAEALDLRGSVLVAPEGLNLFLAAAAERIDAFLARLYADPEYGDAVSGMPVKVSASRAVPFAKLKVKVKPEIIAFRREDASPLQLERAPAVSPERLRAWIERGQDDRGRRLVLVDTRNREETAYGSFERAWLPPIDNFTELPAAIEAEREGWKDAAVVAFCTGGIRCEKAVLWMRANGLPDAMQLDGGILGYFEHEGGAGYRGDCFVFDARVALDPALRPIADDGTGSGSGAADAANPLNTANKANTANLAENPHRGAPREPTHGFDAPR